LDLNLETYKLKCKMRIIQDSLSSLWGLLSCFIYFCCSYNCLIIQFVLTLRNMFIVYQYM
jgi:hypothetical protein